MKKEPIVSIQHIKTRFGDRLVHDDVTLSVYQGEIYGLLGGSGSGKTTLLREMIMLLEPTAGEVQVLGYDLTHITPSQAHELRSRWGVLFQFGALFTSLTIEQNVAIWLKEYTKLSPRQIREIVYTKLAMVGLGPQVGGLYPAELSGGMVKRAALARALVMDPQLLFLDEPTSGLDPVGAESFDKLIKELRHLLNLTIIMITHDIDTIFSVVDRMAILSGGRVAAEGTLEEVIACEDPFIRRFFGSERARLRLEAMQRKKVEV